MNSEDTNEGVMDVCNNDNDLIVLDDDNDDITYDENHIGYVIKFTYLRDFINILGTNFPNNRNIQDLAKNLSYITITKKPQSSSSSSTSFPDCAMTRTVDWLSGMIKSDSCTLAFQPEVIIDMYSEILKAGCNDAILSEIKIKGNEVGAALKDNSISPSAKYSLIYDLLMILKKHCPNCQEILKVIEAIPHPYDHMIEENVNKLIHQLEQVIDFKSLQITRKPKVFFDLYTELENFNKQQHRSNNNAYEKAVQEIKPAQELLVKVLENPLKWCFEFTFITDKVTPALMKDCKKFSSISPSMFSNASSLEQMTKVLFHLTTNPSSSSSLNCAELLEPFKKECKITADSAIEVIANEIMKSNMKKDLFLKLLYFMYLENRIMNSEQKDKVLISLIDDLVNSNDNKLDNSILEKFKNTQIYNSLPMIVKHSISLIITTKVKE
ncbi:hypothetical protein [Trichoplusia ni ascovirus 6b]|nr:hypothetical protein [Trichoplusia ni ascovirus 6b]